MKNFTNIEEKQLINQLWNIHDEIFSLPAKRYIFAIVNEVLGGAALVPYAFMKVVNNKKVTVVHNFYDINKFKFQFGDRLIIVYCEMGIDIRNDIFFKKESINKDYPNHDSIVVNTNFLYYNSMVTLYREIMLKYKYKNHNNYPKISKSYAFEYMISKVENNNEKY